jgi:hypothetical protein
MQVFFVGVVAVVRKPRERGREKMIACGRRLRASRFPL